MNTFDVDICVITYKRPTLLERAIRSILTTKKIEDYNARIIVVDNDTDQSAKPVVDRIANEYSGLVSYHTEPRKGYSHARNRCLEISDSDTIVFLDDDQWVTNNWLSALIEVQRQYDAAVVFGPVLASLPPDTPAWIRQGGFFNRDRKATGEPQAHGGSGNALIKKSELINTELRFDPEFSRSGGEDHELFSRIYRAGNLMVWADEAISYEEILPDKLTLSWIISRAFRAGGTFSKVHVQNKSLPQKSLWYSRKLLELFVSAALVPLSFMKGKGHGVKMLSRAISNLGVLASAARVS